MDLLDDLFACDEGLCYTCFVVDLITFWNVYLMCDVWYLITNLLVLMGLCCWMLLWGLMLVLYFMLVVTALIVEILKRCYFGLLIDGVCEVCYLTLLLLFGVSELLFAGIVVFYWLLLFVLLIGLIIAFWGLLRLLYWLVLCVEFRCLFWIYFGILLCADCFVWVNCSWFSLVCWLL